MDAFPTILTSRRVVPNVFPVIPNAPYRIAIVGEAPGEYEENHGVPFVGPSGGLLNSVLRSVGIDRNACYVGNVCQVRPPQNDITKFDWTSDEIQSGLRQLKTDLNDYNPNICLLLGGTPLRAAAGCDRKITAWRGSLFSGTDINSAFYSRKCLATLHPASILREFSGYPLFRFDLGRCAAESRDANLVLPSRTLEINHDAGTLCHIMDTWPAGLPCSIDIEGGLPITKVNDSVKADAKSRRHIGWRCVSLSSSPLRGFTIAWWKFSDIEHAMVLKSFARLMGRTDVPKVLQNSLYDMFVLAFGYRILIRGLHEDTMLKGWEVYSELPKGLSTQASIWTREPHWKDDEMYETTGDNLALGCAKDTTVTLEISHAQDQYFAGDSPDMPRNLRRLQYSHYRENLQMLNPLLYMELRGIRYDKENAEKTKAEVQQELSTLGEFLSTQAGSELRGAKGSLSSQRLAKALYEVKKYPPQFKRENGRKSEKLTTDVEAILTLRRKFTNDPFLNGILRHRHLEGLKETLEIETDRDGRVRCGYNVVGTETGRLTCYTSPTGAGANLQTITKKLRVNYVADPGYDFFQCDLAGADGWTVAAHCDLLGDSTMLEDYYFGLKPARILALLFDFGPEINRLDRPSLKNSCRAVDSDGWLYFASKRVQHGTNYLMGIPTMQTQIMKDSFKLSGEAIHLEHASGSRLQALYFSRYRGVQTWHRWAEATLIGNGYLTSASGHTRVFFGARSGTRLHDTVKEFLADEPQQNTTYATNKAMLKLWNDPHNRIVRRSGRYIMTATGVVHAIPQEFSEESFPLLIPGALLIEPLHTVHDALCGQWPQFLRDWAIPRARSYFDNPLKIAGREITIPFEGAYGPSWGEVGAKNDDNKTFKPNCGII